MLSRRESQLNLKRWEKVAAGVKVQKEKAETEEYAQTEEWKMSQEAFSLEA